MTRKPPPLSAPRKNKRPNPGINHPESHAAIVSRAQLDYTTAEHVARFDRGVAHEAVAGASEGDLLRWLDEVQLTRRRPWTGIVGVQTQVGEDSRDGVCLHHHGEQLAAATAARTTQDVDGEAPLEQLGPGEAARAGSRWLT